MLDIMLDVKETDATKMCRTLIVSDYISNTHATRQIAAASDI